MDFKDISSEAWREYRFPKGETVRIESPIKLHVSASGGHRVADAQGLSHYVAPSWLSITWRPRDGADDFVV